MHDLIPKTLDVMLSNDTASRIRSKDGECFDNAYKAALLTEGAVYTQGFLAFDGAPYKPVEHSWIELGDRIVDPTFPHLDKSAEKLYYFPAQSLSVSQLKATLEESREDYPEDDPLPVYGSSPYEYYGDVMLGGVEYLTAYQAAEVKCRELNKPSNFERA